MRRIIALVGILVGVGVALAFIFIGGGSDPKYRSHAEADRANAAILVAKCDAAMSSLDTAMESAKADPALAVQRTSKLIADRLTTCTKAQAAAQRAKAVSSVISGPGATSARLPAASG